MQTERVTFLTTPDHKAALDAFATGTGRSVGHVLREASSDYIARSRSVDEAQEEAMLAALLPEVEAAVAEMVETIAEIRADIARTCAVVDAVLAGEKA